MLRNPSCSNRILHSRNEVRTVLGSFLSMTETHAPNLFHLPFFELIFDLWSLSVDHRNGNSLASSITHPRCDLCPFGYGALKRTNKNCEYSRCAPSVYRQMILLISSVNIIYRFFSLGPRHLCVVHSGGQIWRRALDGPRDTWWCATGSVRLFISFDLFYHPSWLMFTLLLYVRKGILNRLIGNVDLFL